jgi:hypothetical protein
VVPTVIHDGIPIRGTPEFIAATAHAMDLAGGTSDYRLVKALRGIRQGPDRSSIGIAWCRPLSRWATVTREGWGQDPVYYASLLGHEGCHAYNGDWLPTYAAERRAHDAQNRMLEALGHRRRVTLDCGWYARQYPLTFWPPRSDVAADAAGRRHGRMKEKGSMQLVRIALMMAIMWGLGSLILDNLDASPLGAIGAGTGARTGCAASPARYNSGAVYDRTIKISGSPQFVTAIVTSLTMLPESGYRYAKQLRGIVERRRGPGRALAWIYPGSGIAYVTTAASQLSCAHLASVLAHEGSHEAGHGEPGAYAIQAEVLREMGERWLSVGYRVGGKFH